MLGHRLAVLCLPQLAGQWQSEPRDKFHIDAEQVLPSTAKRLEHPLRTGESIFDRYPYVIVSTDFVKSDRRHALYPRWQFGTNGEILEGLPEAISAAREVGMGPEELHFFMVEPDERLGGEGPVELLRHGIQ